MKKIIVTLCSLALSLAGTFGFNQLASKDEAVIDKDMEQVSVEQDAEDAEESLTLPADEDKIEVNDEKAENASEVEVAAPKVNEAESKDTKDTVVTNNKNDEKVTVSINKNSSSNKAENNKTSVNKTTDNKSVNNNAATLNNNLAKQATNTSNSNQNTTVNTQGKTTSNTTSYKNNGNNVYVYKNIDLSNCTSAEEVVEVLQKNGCSNINMSNIQNISSLEDILSAIGNGSQGTAQGSNNTTQKNNTSNNTTSNTTTNNTTTNNTTTNKNTTSSKNNTGTTQSNTTNNTSNSISSFAEEVLRLVNVERSKAGLSALSTTTTLQNAANKRAQETAVSFSHTRPNGTKFSTVLQEYGISYRTAGENIAYGQRTPQEVVNGWMNSPGHRANILNANFNKIGIGVYQSNGVIYWSQLFTN